MSDLSWHSILLVLVVDAALAMGASAFVGWLLASAVDRPKRLGILVGAALPFIGPLVWAVRASLAGSFGGRPSTTLGAPLRGSLGVLLALPGLAYLIAMGLPWAGVEGNVKGYRALGEASPLDSMVGAFGLGVGAVILLGCAVTLIRAAPWTASALVVAVSGFWLAMSIDTVISFDALNRVAAKVGDLSGGVGEAHVSTGSGTWTVLAASVVALIGGLILGGFVSRSRTFTPVVAAESPMVTTSLEYGDGF